MSGRTPQHVVWVIAALMCAGAAQAASDADDDPGEQTGRRFLHLGVDELYFALESEWQSHRLTEPGRRGGTQTDRDWSIEEVLGLGLDGHLLDPNLLWFGGSLELGLRQSWHDEAWGGRSRSESGSGTMRTYDVRMDLLREKPVSLSVYARRLDTRVSRRFLPSLFEDQLEHGLSLVATTGPVTTEVGYAFRDVERDGNRNRQDDEDYRNQRLYLDSTWQVSKWQRLQLAYEHEEDRSQYQGSLYDFRTDRDQLRIDHAWQFGDKQRHRLDTYVRINEERGDLARDELQFSTRLALRHTDQVRSGFRYGFYRYGQDAVDVDQHKLDADVTLEPAVGWRITFDGYGLDERASDDIDVDEYGGGVDLSYRAKSGLGEWTMDAGIAYDRSRTTGSGRQRFVRDEAHALSRVRSAVLLEPNVVLASLVGHDANRSRYYLPGRDYQAFFIGSRVAILRLPSGRLVEDDLVYFDYAYRVPTHAVVDAVTSHFSLEHPFACGWTPYYRYEGRCEHVQSVSWGVPRARDNMNRHRAGLRCERKRWMLDGAYEVFDDSVEPYDAVHLTGRWSPLQRLEHSVDISGLASRYAFEGGADERDVWWLEVDVHDRLWLGRYLSLDTALSYHFEDDSRDGDTHGVDAAGTLALVRNYLTVELTVEYDLLTLDESRRNDYGVFVRVRRDLSHVLPAARRVR